MANALCCGAKCIPPKTNARGCGCVSLNGNKTNKKISVLEECRGVKAETDDELNGRIQIRAQNGFVMQQQKHMTRDRNRSLQSLVFGIRDSIPCPLVSLIDR